MLGMSSAAGGAGASLVRLGRPACWRCLVGGSVMPEGVCLALLEVVSAGWRCCSDVLLGAIAVAQGTARSRRRDGGGVWSSSGFGDLRVPRHVACRSSAGQPKWLLGLGVRKHAQCSVSRRSSYVGGSGVLDVVSVVGARYAIQMACIAAARRCGGSCVQSRSTCLV